MPPIPAIASVVADFTRFRREIHAHPELAFQERRTSALVAEQLHSFGLEVHTGLAQTGVVARLTNGTSPRCIGLRADMDALPIQEENDFAHRSTVDGCFHGCGHDGHTVMLLAAAKYLSESRNFDGTVHFIFQPGEETAGGGRVMVEEGLFERFPCDEIYALHNWPGLPLGQIAVRAGPVMAATDQWDLAVIGKGGHAAFPHTTVDPIYVATQIVQAWQGLISRELRPTATGVISTTRFSAGQAYNVIPDRAQLGGTVRTLELEVQDYLERRMQEVAQGVAASMRARVEFRYGRGYPMTINDAACAQHAASAMEALVGSGSVVTQYEPSMGGEDFSFMLQSCPGAYLWLGQGDATHQAALHSSNYDFNDAALPLGASVHASLVEARLPA